MWNSYSWIPHKKDKGSDGKEDWLDWYEKNKDALPDYGFLSFMELIQAPPDTHTCKPQHTGTDIVCSICGEPCSLAPEEG